MLPLLSALTKFWRRTWVLWLAWFIWLVLAWLVAQQFVWIRSQQLVDNEQIALEQTAQKMHEGIAEMVKQQHAIPRLMAMHGEAITWLQGTRSATTQSALNAYLKSVTMSTGIQVAYLLDEQGRCVAASNVDQHDSFLGGDFAERAYFKDAIQSKLGSQYAMGKVSNIPGLYFSAPIYAQRRIVGVAVVKLALDNLRHFMGSANSFIADRNGVIILATDKRLELNVLSNNQLGRLSPSALLMRYKRITFPSLTLHTWSQMPLTGVYQHATAPYPLLLSRPYATSDPDVTLYVQQPLPQLQGSLYLQSTWFSLLALLGTVILLASAWRHSLVRNRKALARTLHESEARFRAMADSAPALIWMSDVNHLGVWFNRSWLEHTGRSLEEELGAGWMFSVHPDDIERVRVFEPQAPDYVDKRPEVEYRLRRADGSYGWVADTGTAYYDLHGRFQGYISYCWDITQRKKNEEQIRQLAFYDSLTLLPNRRLLNDRLLQAIHSSRRDQHYAALFFIDLDNFKPLNDTYGHAAGDLLLNIVAQRLLDCVRQMDTVARFGGDEFVVLLTGLSQNFPQAQQEAVNLAEKLRASLSQPYMLTFDQGEGLRHVEHHCTTSIGGVLFQGDSMPQRDIMRHADAAMYRAKDAGRDTVCFHETY